MANDHLRVQHWDETLDIDHDDYGIIWYLFCQLKVVMGWSAVDFLWPHWSRSKRPDTPALLPWLVPIAVLPGRFWTWSQLHLRGTSARNRWLHFGTAKIHHQIYAQNHGVLLNFLTPPTQWAEWGNSVGGFGAKRWKLRYFMVVLDFHVLDSRKAYGRLV